MNIDGTNNLHNNNNINNNSYENNIIKTTENDKNYILNVSILGNKNKN